MAYTFPHVVAHHDFFPSVVEDLLKIPGVRKQGKRLAIAHHAIPIVAAELKQRQINFSYVDWGLALREPKDWDYYNQRLAETALRPWVLDGFLTQFQKDAMVRTGHLTGGHLWHPTGAGKTLSAILWCLIHDGPIVAVTRAASRLQFGREFERFTTLRPLVLRPNGTSYEKYCETIDHHPVLVVGWESLTNNIDLLEQIAVGGSVIFDESHRGKSSKRWQAIPLPEPEADDNIAQFYKRQEREAKGRGGFIPNPEDNGKYGGPNMGRVMIVPHVNMTTAASRLAKVADRRICTTATPIKDRVRDLWAQLDLAEPYGWGASGVWVHRYCDAKPGRYGGLDNSGESNVDELRGRLETVAHRIDYHETHRQLPPKRRQSVYVAPCDQNRATAGFAAQMRAAAKRGATAILEVRLAQAASRKRKAILDMVSDGVGSGHKIVIFTGRRRDVDELGNALKKHKDIKRKNPKIWAAHGGIDTKQRQQIVDDYMADKGPCVLVGTGDAFGESLNMQDTDAAYFVMLPYTPGQIRQWEGRFCRLGQKRPVTIYYVIAEDSVDEHVADILINKMGPVERIIQDHELAESKEAIGGLDDEDLILDSILSKMEDA